MRRLIALGMLVMLLVGTLAGSAAAHNVTVTTPTGTHCQFLGGPGNPGHSGHGGGHLTAKGAEGSSTMAIVGGPPCMSGVGPGS